VAAEEEEEERRRPSSNISSQEVAAAGFWCSVFSLIPSSSLSPPCSGGIVARKLAEL